MKLVISRLAMFLITVGSVSILAGCSTTELQSNLRTNQIVIDGYDTEWSDYKTFYDEKARVVIGVANDHENIYIRFSSSSRMKQAQLIRQGFTVWFDSEGGKKKNLGIHFPVGNPEAGKSFRGRNREESKQEKQQAFLQDAQTLIEFLSGGDGEGTTMSPSDAEAMGIEARIGIREGFMVYELKVPLINKDVRFPYEISMGGNEPVGMGFEMGKMAQSSMKKQGGGGRGGGKGGRPGGGKGGGRTGGRGGQQPESLEIWAKVHLANT